MGSGPVMQSKFDFTAVNPYYPRNLRRSPAPRNACATNPMLKAVILQVVATLIAALLAGALFGVSGAISAAGAGVACVLPSWLFAVRLAAMARRTGGASVAAFVAGEFIKIASIVGLLVLVWAVYPDLHWGGMLIGLILALKANLFAFLVKT